MAASLTIRTAVESDLAAIRDLGHRVWPETYGFAGADYVAEGLATWWSTDALRRSLVDTVLLVALDGDEIVGVGNIDFRDAVPVVWKLYVLPSAQGRGVGSGLLAALVERARGRASAVQLEYLAGNERAGAFYAAKGFVELRREPAEQPGWPEQVWVSCPVPAR